MANAEPKTEPDNSEQPTAPLNSKTCFLRVSMHCQGCKKKVQKIIESTPGVKVTDVDMRDQKVTLGITENIHPSMLISKLSKAGKKAELLWLEPEKPVSVKEKKQSKAKNKEKENDPNSLEDGKEKNGVKVDKLENQEGNRVVKNRAHGEEEKESGGKSGAHKDDIVIEMGKTKKEVPAGDRAPAMEQPPVSENAASAEKSSGSNKSDQTSGSSGKKEKSKGQNGNKKDSNLEQQFSDCDAPPRTGSGSNPVADNGPVNNRSFPRQHMDPQPAHFNYVTSRMLQQPQPGFGVANQSPPRHHGNQYHGEYHGPPISVANYNTAYPSSSYTASYYVPQPPPPSSYAYVHPGPGPCPVPGHENQVMMPAYNPYLAPRPDSFELFSDENPNACSIV